MASGYCFTGRSQMIQGRAALLFGVDGMSGLGQKDLIPGMHHELFHRYHRQFFDFEGSSGYPLWTTLWAEGMATYVAELLNPSAARSILPRYPWEWCDKSTTDGARSPPISFIDSNPLRRRMRSCISMTSIARMPSFPREPVTNWASW